MKVALIHDWITGYRGGEKCLSAFLDLYPEADIYTLLHKPGSSTEKIDSRVKGTSFLQKFPLVEKYYRLLLPLYPLAVKSLKLEKYDLVISLSHAAVKNISLPDDTVHVCYCFTPMRYVWDQAFYYFGILTYPLLPILRWLRNWDRNKSRGVDRYIAISKFVAARIRCFYKRSATVIYPPVDTAWIKPNLEDKREYFLWAGALVPYKRPDLVVRVCSENNIPLLVAGSGPLEASLKKIAGPSVEFLGRVSDEKLAELYRGARALIFPAIEDFGMMTVECMAAGTPVIALERGGSKEILKACNYASKENLKNSGITGVFINKSQLKNKENLLAAIREISNLNIKPSDCVDRAKLFSVEVFKKDWEGFFEELRREYPVLGG